MANSYKKDLTTITSTGNTTIYTTPAQTTAILKTCWVYNNSGGNTALILKINSTDLGYDATVADKYTKSFIYLASGDLIVLEEGDTLTINTTAQPINAYLALLEISKT